MVLIHVVDDDDDDDDDDDSYAYESVAVKIWLYVLNEFFKLLGSC